VHARLSMKIVATALGFTWLLASCAATAPALKAGAAPDASNGVIYGRMRVIKNGEEVTRDAHWDLIKPYVAMQFSPFEGADKLMTSSLEAGKWFLDTDLSKGGLFSTVLPVGRYYAVCFQMDGFNAITAMRVSTYRSITGSRLVERNVLLFDVLPGKSLYIGDFVHSLRANGGGFDWRVDIADGESAARQLLVAASPGVVATDKQLARLSPLR